MWSTPGNEGWSGREGQAPGSSGTKVRLTPAGEMVVRGEASRHGSCRWSMGLDTVGHRARMLFRHWAAIPHMFVDRITDSCQSGQVSAGKQEPDSPIGMGRGSLSVVPPVPGARKHGRGMRPAVGDRPSPQNIEDGHTDVSDRLMVISDGLVVRENTRVVPLSIEAEAFSLKTVPKNRVPTGEGSDGSENCVPSQEMHEGVVGWSEAVVSTTAVAGASSPADFAGVAAPANLAGTDVLAVAGTKLSAVAEVYSSAVDDEGAPLVIRASRQRPAVVGEGPVRPGGKCGGLVDGMTVPEPIEHSVVVVPNDGGNSYVDIVTVPKPIEHSVVGVPNEGGNSSVDIVTVPEPIEHLLVGVHNEMSNSSVDIVTVPDPIEHSGVRGTADPPAATQLMMHSEASGDWENGRQDHTSDDNTTLDVLTEDQRLSPDDEEAIVVGAVGSAAPWFLTGWADEVEIEFMIDTGCQVTILATSVFERMCVSDPQVRS